MVDPETLQLILADYDLDAERRADEQAWWQADGLPFSEVIRRVGLASIRDKRHPHQYLLQQGLTQRAVEALQAVEGELREAKAFDQLHEIVRRAFRRHWGLGELAIYDTAERLRHRLGLASPSAVHLHRGTRDGARAILGRLQKGQAEKIDHSALPSPLSERCPHEIEDILCIYKDQFGVAPNDFQPRFSGCAAPPCGPPSKPRRRC